MSTLNHDLTPELSPDFTSKVRSAMRKMGWLLPKTDEEVEEAERQIDASYYDSSVDWPDPYDLFEEDASQSSSQEEKGSIPTDYGSKSVLNSRTEESFAVAAREGDEISEEVREKMNKDREKAEKEQEEDDEQEDE